MPWEEIIVLHEWVKYTLIVQVQVSYKLDTAKSYTSIKRDVRRLVLLLPREEQSQHDEVGGVNTGM